MACARDNQMVTNAHRAELGLPREIPLEELNVEMVTPPITLRDWLKCRAVLALGTIFLFTLSFIDRTRSLY